MQYRDGSSTPRSLTALCAETHRHYGIIPDLSLAERQLPTYVPISLSEFAVVGRKYPILFLRDEITYPVAVTGSISLGGAAFNVSRDLSTSDLPGVLQMDPFMFEKLPDQDNGILIFDENNGRVVPLSDSSQAKPIFDKSGNPTELLKRIALLGAQLYEGRQSAIELSCDLLRYNLLIQSPVEINDYGPHGQRRRRLYAIDERAYRALPSNVIYDWFIKGWIEMISIISLTQRHWISYGGIVNINQEHINS